MTGEKKINKSDVYNVELVWDGTQCWVRLKFKNGKIFMHSEKYKNRSYARNKAVRLYRDLNNNYIPCGYKEIKEGDKNVSS